MAIAPEQPMIIACIIVEALKSEKKSQFSNKVQRSGIPFLFKSRLCQIFPILGKNCSSF